MYSPKLGRPMAAGELTKQYEINAPRVRSTSCFCTLRGLLLVWAFLRLVVSVLWTAVIIITIIVPFLSPGHRQHPSRLMFGAIATILQLVEFGMIVTFITAGVKKSASLYRAYYRYCILTLIIYIIAVTLCFALDYDSGHYFGEIYLTYHSGEFLIIENDSLVFAGAAILDICLEIFLIVSIKGLITKYSYGQNYAAGENV